MVLEAVQLLEPERVALRLIEVEQAGVDDGFDRRVAEICLDQLRIGIERAYDSARGLPLLFRGG